MRILLSCPNCQRRYDASKFKIGARVRCNCGQVMRVQPPQGHDAAVIRCSSCGAPREQGNHRCGFCSADFTLHERDLHTVCPQCFARVSDRATFCHSCGDQLSAEAVAGSASSFACPACGDQSQLMSRRLGQERISVAECQRCAGLWISQASFVQLRDRVAKNAVQTRSLFPPKPNRQHRRGEANRYRHCVECDQLMNRRQYAPGSGVIVDVCREHGIWFDDEELAQVLDWIARGGRCVGRLDPTDSTNRRPSPVREPPRDTAPRRAVDDGHFTPPDPGDLESVVLDVVESVLRPLVRFFE